jgi:hypothetical protein
MHNNIPRTKESILAAIKLEVRAKILAKGHFHSLGNSLSLVKRWNLHTLM